ncbi:MAG TPA: sodium:proton antiporter, partial [Rhodospirillaceae bacterium]|nr:sodium:proton antiporter [Rhodospirillaceae bacterium]
MAGRIALGWLVVQDLIVIIGLVLFPVLGGSEDTSATKLLISLGQTLLQITGFIAVMVIGGRRVIPWLLGYV